MEIKREEKINENGSHTVKTVTKVTNDDGWVDADEVFKNNHEPKNKLFKGKAVSFNFETDDPKVTRPFVRIISSVFIVIGLILIIIGFLHNDSGSLAVGGAVLIVIVLFWINGEKTINEIEAKYYKNQNNNNTDTPKDNN
jgi:hypothetical protein